MMFTLAPWLSAYLHTLLLVFAAADTACAESGRNYADGATVLQVVRNRAELARYGWKRYDGTLRNALWASAQHAHGCRIPITEQHVRLGVQFVSDTLPVGPWAKSAQFYCYSEPAGTCENRCSGPGGCPYVGTVLHRYYGIPGFKPSRKEPHMSQSALYSAAQAKKANLTMARLGLTSWEAAEVIALQAKVGAKPADGWFGPKSIEAWKTWARIANSNPVGDGGLHPDLWGAAILGGAYHPTPAGLKLVNFKASTGIPAQLEDTNERTRPVTQLLLHQGAESHSRGENYAQATERVLDARGLSTLFSMDIDGVIYQHFDPALRRGRHCTYHNVQSDSLDVGGPFSRSTTKVSGQELLTFQAAIGRSTDNKPPLSRDQGWVKCWTMTPAQKESLVLFVPWWCRLRGIPMRACSDWRNFRLSGDHGLQDPVTNVTGILAHGQVSEPGSRVDGFTQLETLFAQGETTGIQWRTGPQFFDI